MLAGPVRAQDPAGGDSGRCGRVRPRRGVHPGDRAGGSDDPHHLTSTYRELADDLEVGQSVLFADGTVAMDVVGPRPWLGAAEGHAAGPDPLAPGNQRAGRGLERGGPHRKRPGRPRLDQRSTTSTYVGLSFVRTADDISRLRDELDRTRQPAHGSSPRSRSRRPSRTSRRSSRRPTP